MPKIELTDRFCQAAKSQEGARKSDYFDTVVKGLCLRASAGGARAFYLVYSRPGDGKRAWLRIGRYPEVKLAKAREKARDARGEVGEGQDPIAEKRAHAASQTVADVVENYITRHAATKRTGDAIARRLRKNVTAIIGDLKIADLHRRDITRCIDAVTDRGAAIEANRVFEDVRAMLRWARGRGDLDINLVDGMRKPNESQVRDRVLTADEIRTMWNALASADMWESSRRIIRLCLITGQRVGEVAGMARDETRHSTGDMDDSKRAGKERPSSTRCRFRPWRWTSSTSSSPMLRRSRSGRAGRNRPSSFPARAAGRQPRPHRSRGP